MAKYPLRGIRLKGNPGGKAGCIPELNFSQFFLDGDASGLYYWRIVAGVTMEFLGIACLVVMFFCFTMYLTGRNKSRIVAAAAVAKIGDAHGLCLVSGTADTASHLVSPYGQEKCLCYETMIEYWDEISFSDSQESGEWRMVMHDHKQVSFQINDGTGRLIVNPARAEMELFWSVNQIFGGSRKKSALPERLLALVGFRAGGWPANTRFRVQEKLLRAGEVVSVVADIGTQGMNKCAGVISGQEQFFLATGKPKRFIMQTKRVSRFYLVSGWLVTALFVLLLVS